MLTGTSGEGRSADYHRGNRLQDLDSTHHRITAVPDTRNYDSGHGRAKTSQDKRNVPSLGDIDARRQRLPDIAADEKLKPRDNIS